MLIQLEALVALREAGTMARAATALRLTPSAISKRIAALEASLGHALIERQGRSVRMTPAGERLVERARPLLDELRGAVLVEAAEPAGRLALGVSESILSSWGARVLAAVAAELPGLALELHAHRAPVALERVRAGEYALALVSGEATGERDLVSQAVLEEEMVVVPAGLERAALAKAARFEVLTIEASSATWSALAGRVARLEREAGVELAVRARLESFTCVVQLARAGFGHGLAPRGVAEALGCPPRTLVRLPAPGLARPVRLVGRAATLARPLAAAFRDELVFAARRAHAAR